MVPHRHTATEVSIVEQRMSTLRVAFTFTPIVRASSSPNAITLMRQRMAIMRPPATSSTAPMMATFFIAPARAKLPMSQ